MVPHGRSPDNEPPSKPSWKAVLQTTQHRGLSETQRDSGREQREMAVSHSSWAARVETVLLPRQGAPHGVSLTGRPGATGTAEWSVRLRPTPWLLRNRGPSGATELGREPIDPQGGRVAKVRYPPDRDNSAAQTK
jgi:hypothetical protein